MSNISRAGKIKLLSLDTDGVLTSGQLFYTEHGEFIKAFNTQDGLGIKLAQKSGLIIAIITGRTSLMLQKRAEELGIADIYQGVEDKQRVMDSLRAKYKLDTSETAHIGDDLNDLPILRDCGLACAVANAVDEVKTYAHFITARQGGNGAVRETIEFILKAQNKWENSVNYFLK